MDMGAFIANLGEIREATRSHIAVIHHGTRASEGSRPRGHSSLEGADDALIEVTKHADGTRSATLIHSKDDADGMRWGFELDVVELGTDGDGDPITTLIVEERSPPPAAAPQAKLPDDQQIALTSLSKALRADGTLQKVGLLGEERSVVTEADWRRWYYSQRPGDSQDAKQKAFRRAMVGLLAKERIVCENEFVWIPLLR